MTDKLTDSEIVKALECCVSEQYTCGQCPFQEIKHYDDDYGFEIMPNGKQYDDWSCERWLNVALLDLINRLQAENERLKGYQKDGFFNLLGNCLVFSKTLKDYNDMRKGLKTEAYKEFAEKSEKEIFIKQEDERKQMLKILKTYRGTRTYSDTEQATDNWLRGYGEAVQDILGVFDNLLKELVGQGEEPPKPNWQDSMINTFLGGKQ